MKADGLRGNIKKVERQSYTETAESELMAQPKQTADGGASVYPETANANRRGYSKDIEHAFGALMAQLAEEGDDGHCCKGFSVSDERWRGERSDDQRSRDPCCRRHCYISLGGAGPVGEAAEAAAKNCAAGDRR